uniref:Uncharacterized protein n=1 Tax=Aegilops tauschii subsp. strangulata TaxID=200361 RepID=A0A452Z717_AEGTS
MLVLAARSGMTSGCPRPSACTPATRRSRWGWSRRSCCWRPRSPSRPPAAAAAAASPGAPPSPRPGGTSASSSPSSHGELSFLPIRSRRRRRPMNMLCVSVQGGDGDRGDLLRAGRGVERAGDARGQHGVLLRQGRRVQEGGHPEHHRNRARDQV